MKTHNSTRAWMATATIVGATALTTFTSSLATAQTGAPLATQQGAPAGAAATPPQSDQQREAWRADMARRPLPKTGCFTAAYPSTEWQEVPCGRPSPVPNQRGSGARGNLVGNGVDFAAKTSSLISSVTGSFLPGSIASGVTADVAFTTISPNTPAVANNVFMLQINTQANFLPDGSTFSTPACNGIAGCFGWQQFLFSQTQGPPPTGSQQSAAPGVVRLPICSPASVCSPSGLSTPGVFVEYWLFNYGATCPTLPAWAVPSGMPATTLWNSDGGGDCWFNGPITYVTPQTAADLPGLVMTATASPSLDTVLLATASNMYAYNEPNVLSLSLVWTEAEFNVFGDCCGTETSFTSPTVLIVKTSINDGTANAPTCVPNDGSTGETNNLNFEPTSGPVCCPYGGASPAIEFDEADSTGSHTASCGPTKIEGDPHLTTADGTHYDFQAAGEFVTLRDPDGMEIQTRQTPIPTTFFPAPNPYDGLATCVSINTAVAARVGGHRVTWEPHLSGVPDPSGLQLRIDGALTVLQPQGLALGSGGRVTPAAGGALRVDFPDGKTLLATPEWWVSQSKWFLNVDISHLGLVSDVGAATGRGIAGAVANGSWLPALPNGASMGPIPASLPARYDALYGTFTDAWRVTDKDSLFDYAPGTSTSTFTMRDWPKQSPPCVVPGAKPVEPATDAVAEAVCRRVREENRHADCVFDVKTTGNIGFAKTYLETQRILAYSTSTSLIGGEAPSQPGEWVTFTALIAPYSSPGGGVPSGTVQFAVDGATVAEPVMVDAKGRATWDTSRLKVGEHRLTATYVPGADSAFLPSTSAERLHVVRRCPCGDAPK